MDNFQKIPDNFQKIIMDMTDDFTETFPEYSELWIKWTKNSFELMTEEEVTLELKYLHDYVISTYPERFFDIIYQNETIFLIENELNTLFLPGIDFKLLFNCSNISDQTRKIMWNYLKLILLTVVGSVKDKSKFGGSGNIFDGIDEKELFEKLTETMGSMGDFFQNMGQNINEEETKEISGDLSEIFGSDEIGEIRSTKDVIGKLMKNPAKISGLLKTINERLQSKISSGEISQEEMMKEATDIMAKMKGTGDVNFEELFKNMTKMGGMGGMEEMLSKMSGLAGEGGLDMKQLMKTMGGMMGQQKKTQNKEPNIDASKMTLHEKMKNRILIKKMKDVEKQLVLQNQIEESEKNYIPYDFGEDKNVFKIDGEEAQETSLSSSAPKKNKKKKTKSKK